MRPGWDGMGRMGWAGEWWATSRIADIRYHERKEKASGVKIWEAKPGFGKRSELL